MTAEIIMLRDCGVSEDLPLPYCAWLLGKRGNNAGTMSGREACSLRLPTSQAVILTADRFSNFHLS